MTRIEIGPVQGSYAGMLAARAYTIQLPADWPPSSVTVNGIQVKQHKAGGKGGWSFEGNSLTTIIPVGRFSSRAKVTVEIHRGAGLARRRNELDGFPGMMTRLRAAYDALNQTWPVGHPPDSLIDAMQTGDRLSYRPEDAQREIARFHQVSRRFQRLWRRWFRISRSG